jgi:Na+/proline symporter
VAVVDLYNRLWKGRDVREVARTAAGDREQVLASRIATLIIGVLGTTLACNVAAIGSLLEINAKVVNAFTGPLFGIFLLAMFSEGARSGAVLLAGLAGAFTAYYVAYHSSIGFMWPSTFGLLATLVVGMPLAVAFPMAADDKRRALTWRAVMSASAR